MQKPQAGFDMRGKLGRHWLRHAVDRPAAGRAAKRYALLPGMHFDLHDVGRRTRDQALAGKRHHLAQLGPMTADGDRREQNDGQRSGKRRHEPHGAALAWLSVHRRLHHTSTPHSMVESGSSTSSAMNTSRIWRLVRAISGS